MFHGRDIAATREQGDDSVYSPLDRFSSSIVYPIRSEPSYTFMVVDLSVSVSKVFSALRSAFDAMYWPCCSRLNRRVQ